MISGNLAQRFSGRQSLSFRTGGWRIPMTASRDERLPLLSPFPEGWYFIADRKTIEKEKLF